MNINTSVMWGHKFIHPRGRATLFGRDLPSKVEIAIYQQDWDVVRSWAVTVALKSGNAELVGKVEALIPLQISKFVSRPVNVYGMPDV